MANAFETQGLFSWFELLTSDVEGAKSFYLQLFGWTFFKDPNSPIDYTLVSLDGGQKPFAGIYLVIFFVDYTIITHKTY